MRQELQLGSPLEKGRLDGSFQHGWFLLQVAVHIGALVAPIYYFSWAGVIAAVGLHFLMAIGVSVGFHRLLAHRSFKTSRTNSYVLSTLGTLAMQGGPLTWVAIHRAHHARGGRSGDAHSAKRGFLWSHWLWMLYRAPNGFVMAKYRKSCRDIASNTYLRFLERNFLKLNAATAGVAWVLLDPGLWFWLFPARIVITWHVTWSINSFCHNRPQISKRVEAGEPINVYLLSIMSLGEALHLNHHLKPGSFFFSATRREPDLGGVIARLIRSR